jgi:ketosteroid isomerase-like protein
MREIDVDTRVAIEQLIAELLWRLDHGRADTTWELYTEDAVSTGPLGDMAGRDAIKEWGQRRAKITGVVGRHHVAGIRLAWEGNELHGWTQYVTYRDSSENPLVPASVGEFREVYRKVDGIWKIARRHIAPIFGGPNAAAHAKRLAESGTQ